MFAQISCILLRIICDFTPAFFAIHIVRLFLVISAVSSTSPGADAPTSNVIGFCFRTGIESFYIIIIIMSYNRI